MPWDCRGDHWCTSSHFVHCNEYIRGKYTVCNQNAVFRKFWIEFRTTQYIYHGMSNTSDVLMTGLRWDSTQIMCIGYFHSNECKSQNRVRNKDQGTNRHSTYPSSLLVNNCQSLQFRFKKEETTVLTFVFDRIELGMKQN